MKQPLYLDYNASTPLDPLVAEQMRATFFTHFGNPASKTHSFGVYAEELVNLAREEVAEVIGATPEEIIFTSGATESNNLALLGIVRAAFRRGLKQAHIISVKSEHPSVLEPLEQLEMEGARISLLEVDSKGIVAPESLEDALCSDTILVSIMLANNEIGVIHDIESLSKLCKAKDIPFHCDATQAIGKISVNVKKLDLDFLSLSAHKVYGPKGVGALFVRKKIPKVPLEPLFFGGGHEAGMRAGTLNVPGIVGIGKSCSLARQRLDETRKHLEASSKLMLDTLSDRLNDLTLNGPERNRLPGNLNLRFEKVPSSRLLSKIRSKLAISVSSACASQEGKGSHVLRAIGLEQEQRDSSIRIGIGRSTTKEEVLFACETLIEAVNSIRT